MTSFPTPPPPAASSLPAVSVCPFGLQTPQTGRNEAEDTACGSEHAAETAPGKPCTFPGEERGLQRAEKPRGTLRAAALTAHARRGHGGRRRRRRPGAGLLATFLPLDWPRTGEAGGAVLRPSGAARPAPAPRASRRHVTRPREREARGGEREPKAGPPRGRPEPRPIRGLAPPQPRLPRHVTVGGPNAQSAGNLVLPRASRPGMEARSARPWRAARRSSRAGAEEGGGPVTRWQRAWSSPRQGAEEVPRRALRSSGGSAREEAEAEADATGRARARPGPHGRGEEKGAPGTPPRRARSGGRVRSSGAPEAPKASAPGAGHPWEPEAVWDTSPGSARSSAGKDAAAPGSPGDGKERSGWGTGAGRRAASAPAKCAVAGEDETPLPGPRGRGGPSSHLGEEEPGRRSPRPDAPDPGATAASPGLEEAPPASGEEDEDSRLVRQLLRLKDQIKQQLLEYKAEVEASKESPAEELTEGNLLQRIEELERKMEDVKVELEMKTLALKRVQVAHALQKKLGKKDSESESILAILKNILTLNSSILKAQQQTQELEEKMLEVKKKRLMFKKAGEEKLREIQAEKKKKKDELNLLKNSALLNKMKKSLQKEIDTTTIIQNVFQHIVMAAKIDWAADPTLKALILQLEKNLNFI
ncbi:centromere protein H [Notamacropus eugenii]|uniref:centromere protein H n=1 Tax=Notamacropus eugenii TaxID=9315 RepID=UPI003B670C1C